jgi:hypothetical protein
MQGCLLLVEKALQPHAMRRLHLSDTCGFVGWGWLSSSSCRLYGGHSAPSCQVAGCWILTQAGAHDLLNPPPGNILAPCMSCRSTAC